MSNKSNFLENNRKFLAECVGTFVLVSLAIIVHYLVPHEEFWTALFIYGIGVMALAYCVYALSGCHLNPAVSLGAYFNKEISLSCLLKYLAAQFAGGIFAGALFLLITHIQPDTTSAIHAVSGSAESTPSLLDNIAYYMIVEFVFTFVFVFLVLGTVTKYEKTKLCPFVIGFSLILEHLFAVGVARTSVNPAISLGYAFIEIANEGFESLFLFIVTPLIAGVLAGLCGRVFRFEHEHHEPHAALLPCQGGVCTQKSVKCCDQAQTDCPSHKEVKCCEDKSSDCPSNKDTKCCEDGTNKCPSDKEVKCCEQKPTEPETEKE